MKTSSMVYGKRGSHDPGLHLFEVHCEGKQSGYMFSKQSINLLKSLSPQNLLEGTVTIKSFFQRCEQKNGPLLHKEIFDFSGLY